MWEEIQGRIQGVLCREAEKAFPEGFKEIGPRKDAVGDKSR